MNRDLVDARYIQPDLNSHVSLLVEANPNRFERAKLIQTPDGLVWKSKEGYNYDLQNYHYWKE